MTEVEITAMTFGAYGVGRLGGKTVMVPNSVPGDRVEVEVTSSRRGFHVGRIVRVVRPGPGRRVAPCPYLPRCGGCDWQQLSYPGQLALKAELIRAQLRHATGVEIDPEGLVEPAPAEFRYRARIRLKAGRHGRLGFRELRGRALVEIEQCMVAAMDLGPARKVASIFERGLEEIEIVRGERRYVMIADLRRPATAAEIRPLETLIARDPATAGVIIRSTGSRKLVGDCVIPIEVEPGLVLQIEADLFSQVNRPQNQKLVAAVMEMARIMPGTQVLDLFCGSGNFSLPAARRGAMVKGVDVDPRAVAAAEENARRLSLDEVEFSAMGAEDYVQFASRAGLKPRTIVLDPPRVGARRLMGVMSRLSADSVIYISCDVATLARDLKLLGGEGYELTKVRAFDFFPNTHHVEIVARAVLTSSRSAS